VVDAHRKRLVHGRVEIVGQRGTVGDDRLEVGGDGGGRQTAQQVQRLVEGLGHAGE
jgi:hypothetical protein